jgi:hypothetical protein
MYVVHITRLDDVLGDIAFESKHDAEQAFRLREKVINDDLLSDDEYLDLYEIDGLIEFFERHRIRCHRFFFDEWIDL